MLTTLLSSIYLDLVSKYHFEDQEGHQQFYLRIHTPSRELHYMYDHIVARIEFEPAAASESLKHDSMTVCVAKHYLVHSPLL